MRLVFAGLMVLLVFTLQAQKPGPVFLPRPTPDYWIQDSLALHPEEESLADTIPPELAAPALSDSMLWSYLYLEDSLREGSLTIIGTGDIMLGTNYPSESYLPPGADCSPILRPVHEVLQSGDLLFGNLEGVFCPQGGSPKKCRNLSQCYVFRMPEHFLSCIVHAGYDVLSVANNHVNDFGPAGRASTAALLDSAGLAFAGFVGYPWTLFEKEGVVYGFAAFAPNKGTMDLKDYDRAAEITAMLDSLADVVIISFHGGAEGKDHQHVVRGDEEYLGYNRGSVYHFAHRVVDAGADVVFGHGPHVTRAVELYKDRLICYSLGNFATYRRFNLSGPNGIAPIIKVTVDREGGFLQGEVVSIYQPGEGGPRIDPSARALARLRELSEADFPEQELVVDSDGILWKND
ncbi:MAG: CapA family protein [Bacteroidales bacterium]|nr:CapA family protein [Bacteroidales bacterium]